MRGYMFRNRWGALLFVGLVLAGVAQLVGTGKGDGAIDRATDQLVEQKAEADALAAEHAPGGEQPVEIEFTSDEDLIDPALGDDPTPIDQRAPEGEIGEEAPHDTLILVAKEPEQ